MRMKKLAEADVDVLMSPDPNYSRRVECSVHRRRPSVHATEPGGFRSNTGRLLISPPMVKPAHPSDQPFTVSWVALPGGVSCIVAASLPCTAIPLSGGVVCWGLYVLVIMAPRPRGAKNPKRFPSLLI